MVVKEERKMEIENSIVFDAEEEEGRLLLPPSPIYSSKICFLNERGNGHQGG